MINIKYYILTLVIASFTLVTPNISYAQHSLGATNTNIFNKMDAQVTALTEHSGLQRKPIGIIAGSAIYVVLSLLAIVFLVLLITAGFKWMTAGGNEDQVKSSLNTIKAAIIGLIIVILSYSITYFLFYYFPI